MNNQNFINHIKNLLKNNKQYLDNEGYLLVDEVRRLASRYDEALLNTLYSDEKARKTFFQEVGKATIFKLNDFDFFLEEKLIDNSYTAYENRIGLATGKKMLKDMSDVVLNFPYKDCILEGGQSTEEGLDTYFEYSDKVGEYEEKQAKRKEIFFNQVLAKDEIDRLTEPKAFENIKRYTKEGEEEFTSFNRNGEGTITDNLIIKGNNLLALHSLLPQFEGKVKLIYIDPPYNTGSDSFAYNDNFNHSSWLVFMKNRLEQAKKLLASDGVICIQCSFHEYAYIKVLSDKLFPKFLSTFNIQVRHPDRILTGDKEYNDIIEHTLIYSNNLFGKMPKKEILKTDDEYIYKVVETGEPELIDFGGKQVEIYTPDKYTVEIVNPNSGNTKKISIRGSIREKNSSGRLYVKYIEPIANKYPSETIFKVEGMGDDALGFRYFYTPPQGNVNGGYYQGKPQSSDVTFKPYPNFYNFEKEYNNVSKEGDVNFRNGKKPEELLCFLVSIFSSNNDIVLDYHLGSGTTCAVAHKMGRQYIGVEQLNYYKNDSVVRLNNVIKGDQTGISKSVGWKGGGSFVYMDLAKNNQKAIDYIQNCQSYDDLVAFFDEMCDTYFLDYNLKIKEFREQVSKEENFKQLSLNKQKEMFAKMLDLNQLYVNVSDMEDSKFKMNEKDIRLTNDFYKK